MKTFNEWIRYYLENDKNPKIPEVVDKLGLKEYAKRKGIATPINLETIADTCVIKANNDCGSTVIIKDGKVIKGNLKNLNKYEKTPYGANKGEWFYSKIPHKVFYEEYLGDNITDYKFHCHQGKVMFCQTIFDRNTGKTKEHLKLPNGNILDYRLDENFAFSKEHEYPHNWKDLLEAAKILAKDWNYVRVDLYSVNNKVYVGELTFAPRAGRYKGNGQKLLGKYF
jgi:hypothetical protein